MKEEIGDLGNIILYEQAKRIHSMTKEEKKFTLKRIAQSESREGTNQFWTKISKKMLLNEELTNKILHEFL